MDLTSSGKNISLTDASGKHLQLYAILVKERIAEKDKVQPQSLELMYGYDLGKVIQLVKNKYSATENLAIEVLGNLAAIEFLKPVIDDIKELKAVPKEEAPAPREEVSVEQRQAKVAEEVDLRTDKFLQSILYVHEVVSPVLTDAENKVMMKALKKFKTMFKKRVDGLQ